MRLRRNWARWKIGASLAFFVFFVAAGQAGTTAQKNESPVTSVVERAQAALAHGNPDEAIRELSAYLRTHPSDSVARVVLGQAYAMAGQSEPAKTEFQKVIQRSPANYIALAALGEIFLREGDLQQAESMLERAVKASPGTAQIRIEWAVVLARQHRYKEAQRALAGVGPPSGKEERIAFHRLRASVEMGLGNSSTAASEMERALDISPGDSALSIATATAELQNKNWRRAADLAAPVFSRSQHHGAGLILLESQLELGEDFHPTLKALQSAAIPAAEEPGFRERVAGLLIGRGRFSESVPELRIAAELQPGQAPVLFNLALAEFRAGMVNDAFFDAEKCKALNDSAELEDLIGDIQEARGDNVSAVKSYQAAVALAPTEEKYRLSLALEFIRHKNFDAAKVVLKQAEELHPKSWRVQLSLAMVESFAGTDAEAAKMLLNAADLSPEPEVALRYLGDIQMNQAALPDGTAVARLCEYADKHAADGSILFYCGALLFRGDYASGDKVRAGEILKKLASASRLLPRDASPHCQLGRVYRWIDRWQDALRESETCTRMDPESAEGHYRLAQIYQHLGQPERSQEEMKAYEEASRRVADENARRDETIKTFLLTIQKEAPDHR